jgi:hypothetical protein
MRKMLETPKFLNLLHAMKTSCILTAFDPFSTASWLAGEGSEAGQ